MSHLLVHARSQSHLRLRQFGQLLEKPQTTLSLGERGERAAAKYLRRRGLKIVRRSARDRLGEIDLIAVESRTVVFVEVKTRRSNQRGNPSEAVDRRKQKRLIRAATYFISKHGLEEERTRFDVISIVWPDGNATPQIRHFKNAFQPEPD